jgi:hypothetical protein
MRTQWKDQNKKLFDQRDKILIECIKSINQDRNYISSILIYLLPIAKPLSNTIATYPRKDEHANQSH